ncbi:hypothetical protein [Chryseobacterium jejuense]|uniref:hypothetical protein n=1 Tax=Chryseobacterium jejuense TaxID=445960 RepID=UPI001428C0F0|nr:hypothetical protein [Chryseobacterium jejuense]
MTQEAVQENFENRGKDHADAFPELQKVEYIDFSISRSFGGSFWCSTQPLSRY